MKEGLIRFFTSSETKKYRIVLLITLAVAVFIVGGFIAAKMAKNNPNENYADTTPKAKKTKDTRVVSKLDGLPYSSSVANRHPLAVSVENHPDARPQSGLSKASIVYEAITEGGITRYTAIFGPNDAKEIGPIRSARLYFMDYIKEYDAFFAHAGGNEDALAKMDSYKIKDLNHSGNYFYRDSKGRNVASEHTLYSSTERLYNYAKSKGFDIETSTFSPFKFKTDGPADPAGKGVTVDFSSASYKVSWTYDFATNSYTRFLGGVQDSDKIDNSPIKAKNIIVQVVTRKFEPTGSYGSSNYVFNNIGSGKATIYQDGKEIQGTWKKTSLDSRTKYYDVSGNELEFNPGVTWYEIIPPESSYQAS